MRLALIGASGLVGKEIIKVLEEQNFPVSSFIPVASEKSIGQKILFKGREIELLSIQKALYLKPQIVLFSAGSGPSLEWAPKFAQEGSYVIDNSSAWRYDDGKALIVPEVNPDKLKREDKIIANPNCSTIQLVMVLKALEDKYGIKRTIVSTYQSVTGTGKAAVDQLDQERKGNFDGEKAYPYQIDLNIIPHIDVFQENGYSREEMKIVWESRKILSIPDFAITATAVRVPVIGGHSESVNVELKSEFNLDELRLAISEIKGVKLLDDPKNNIYPMPINAYGKDEVFVGRIRRDESIENGVNLWIVADNLRKGAATNAVQIAQLILKNDWIES
jgi:aspartate-semialdehyde dehydrogenase